MLEPATHRRPRPGVEVWTNARNGMGVVQIHYTADPRKRTPQWKAATNQGMHPRDWKREYEIDWAAPEGEPVIPEYLPATHDREHIPVDGRLRLLRFWDFGFDSPVVLFAQLSLFGQLRFLAELCPFNTPLDALAGAAEAMAADLLGPAIHLARERLIDFAGTDQQPAPLTTTDRMFDAGDPAGRHRGSLGSEVEVLAARGITVHTVRPGTETSYQKLRARFLRHVIGEQGTPEPAVIIHTRCTLLRKALAGAFHKSMLPPYHPVKCHPFKDLVDAARYGNDNLDGMGTSTAALHTMAAQDRIDAVGRRRVG